MKSSKKAKKDSMFLELDGKIYFIERTKGGLKRSELDGKKCLQCLAYLIEDSIRRMVKE